LRMTEGKTMRWSIAGKVPPLPLVYAEIRRGGPAGRTCLVRSGPLTPYLIETIAEDVRAAGHPSHVEARLAPDGDSALLASIRELVRYHLDQEGYAVNEADSGEKALERAAATRPALIILDLMLPGTDGLEVCRRLRTDDTLREVPVIMLTAKGTEVDRILGLELGADDYITKPFSPRELVARVRAV